MPQSWKDPKRDDGGVRLKEKIQEGTDQLRRPLRRGLTGPTRIQGEKESDDKETYERKRRKQLGKEPGSERRKRKMETEIKQCSSESPEAEPGEEKQTEQSYTKGDLEREKSRTRARHTCLDCVRERERER